MVADPIPDSIEQFAAEIAVINQQAVGEDAPLVEAMLRTRSQDRRPIEQALAGRLSFCGFAPVLDLDACRTTWDTDEERQ